jgi:hypothetical protein
VGASGALIRTAARKKKQILRRFAPRDNYEMDDDERRRAECEDEGDSNGKVPELVRETLSWGAPLDSMVSGRRSALVVAAAF